MTEQDPFYSIVSLIELQYMNVIDSINKEIAYEESMLEILKPQIVEAELQLKQSNSNYSAHIDEYWYKKSKFICDELKISCADYLAESALKVKQSKDIYDDVKDRQFNIRCRINVHKQRILRLQNDITQLKNPNLRQIVIDKASRCPNHLL
jgi:hypothetical protein